MQDDQEFDITQSEILGHLFATTATIRVIQASANTGVRDSVPPTSALRFDPSITRKRDREGSARPNGFSPSGAWKPNKRQRVLELDPDEPLPSRESESGRRAGRIPDVNIIPDSQESAILPSSSRHFGTSRNVRQEDPPQIPETPSPSPPPELHGSPRLANGSADQRRGQSDNQNMDEDSKEDLEIENSSPLGQASGRAQSQGSQRAKSGSYHIPRPTERGRSVSTAAKSPFSVDQRVSMQNGITSSSKRKRPEVTQKSHGSVNRSPNEDGIYDNIESENEGAAILRKKKASLKMRNSPNGGLPGIDWANNKFNTPPTGTRRPSRSREDSSAGELPLTPNSKEREKKQREKLDADEAKRARRAAAEAAEQRRLEAEEARQTEEARIAEEGRAKREEQERLEVEEFQREETKRQAVIAKAARLQKEREAEEKKEAEEQKRLEEERIANEKAESERLAKEKAETEAKRLRQEEEERERERQSAEEKRQAEEAMKKKKRSPTPEEPRNRHSASPILPRGTPASTPRPQSSTPFIPSGRKSALKSSLSSQAAPSSSGDPKSSPEVSRDVGIETQMPLPPKVNRKVSFDLHDDRKETPIKPPSRIVPPKLLTPKVPVSTESATATLSKDSTPKTSQQSSGKNYCCLYYVRRLTTLCCSTASKTIIYANSGPFNVETI